MANNKKSYSMEGTHKNVRGKGLNRRVTRTKTHSTTINGITTVKSTSKTSARPSMFLRLFTLFLIFTVLVSSLLGTYSSSFDTYKTTVNSLASLSNYIGGTFSNIVSFLSNTVSTPVDGHFTLTLRPDKFGTQPTFTVYALIYKNDKSTPATMDDINNLKHNDILYIVLSSNSPQSSYLDDMLSARFQFKLVNISNTVLPLLLVQNVRIFNLSIGKSYSVVSITPRS